MTPKEEVIRAEAALRILNEPIFKEAITSVRDGIVNSIANSAMGDDKTHSKLAIALQLLNQIERQLITHVETGKLARLQIDEGSLSKLRRIVNG